MEPPITIHGKIINTTVDTISWSGNTLMDEHFEDFRIAMKLPDSSDDTILYFKTIQDCQNGSIAWTQTPSDQGDIEYPAAKLTLKSQIQENNAPFHKYEFTMLFIALLIFTIN